MVDNHGRYINSSQEIMHVEVAKIMGTVRYGKKIVYMCLDQQQMKKNK